MKKIIRQKLFCILVGLLLVLCFARLGYAGFDFGFEIPPRTITVDGMSDDWIGIDPVFNDPQGDSTCNVGTPIRPPFVKHKTAPAPEKY